MKQEKNELVKKTNIEYFCDICEKKLSFITICKFCGKDICQECCISYNTFDCCVECNELGSVHMDKINGLHIKILENNDSCNQLIEIEMKLWKEKVC